MLMVFAYVFSLKRNKVSLSVGFSFSMTKNLEGGLCTIPLVAVRGGKRCTEICEGRDAQRYVISC